MISDTASLVEVSQPTMTWRNSGLGGMCCVEWQTVVNRDGRRQLGPNDGFEAVHHFKESFIRCRHDLRQKVQAEVLFKGSFVQGIATYRLLTEATVVAVVLNQSQQIKLEAIADDEEFIHITKE